ncbi:FAD-dependent oxidoreductase [candidate division KSB1 bacterium]|nr:FAD-dependent oxidoreductase [candidate division KSB1 bacterium]
MAKHQRFHIKNLEHLKQEAEKLNLEIPITNDISNLFDSISIDKHKLANRFCIHPMEGFDATFDGTPGPYAFRRYQRYAAGGSSLIWIEATAVAPEARSNPGQFYINDSNVNIFKQLVEETHRAAYESMGPDHRPVLILQLTHSGRYSKPAGKPKPIIAHHSPILDPKHNLPPDYPLITDEELDDLQAKYVYAAQLAAQAGFDGVDVKSCHRYLVSELLASFTRENSRYGSSFENRTRFLRETLEKIHAAVPDAFITTRLNVFDAISYPYGFGMRESDCRLPDLTEPVKLVGILKALGFPLINISIGNPYFNPHFGRPFDFPVKNVAVPEEHPLEGVIRLVGITRQIQEAYPDLPVVASGYSWLRHFLPNVAAAVIAYGGATLIGQGRGMFAYPDSVKDLIETGAMNPKKTCVTCSACTQLMRDGVQTGCVVRDSEIYGPIYRNTRKLSLDELMLEAERCRDCESPTCQEGCPAEVNIPGFIKAFARGDIETAYRTLTEKNLLPEICAFVCPASEQCEGGCIERIFSGQSIRIRDVQRKVSQLAREKGIARIQYPEKRTGKHIAVLGAGVAGITCTAALLQKGHSVSVFDAKEHPGGIVRSVLPGSRIQYKNVDDEIEALFAGIPPDRLSWKLGMGISRNFTLDDILQLYHAVFLGMGLQKGISLFENAGSGVVEALTFLSDVKDRQILSVPEKVAVIGGGNTAIDAALAAKELGAQDVYLIYRRSFNEMPSWPDERIDVLNAGIHLLLLTQPTGYSTDGQGKLRAIKLARTVLGEPDDSGRRQPIIQAGDESELPVNLVIEAIGQQVDPGIQILLQDVEFTRNGLVSVKAGSQATTRKGVFAGGDIVNGGTTAVQAVAEGLRAANEIDAYLRQSG